ncbi:adenylosuccinate synthetase [Streptomyces sp. NPDC056883]|uniref:adenylosuccinate synthetase n=1 Tax=Streptomyces sp. NPDC056883 TaxID=3345959 RepID=UPI003682A21F
MKLQGKSTPRPPPSRGPCGGWLDLVYVRSVVELNRYTSIALTKLDVLDTFDRIGICVAFSTLRENSESGGSF